MHLSQLSSLLIIALALCFTAPAQALEPVPKTTSWSGLIPKDAVPKLPNQTKSAHKPFRLSFAMGIGQGQKAFDDFVKGVPIRRGGRGPMLPQWIQNVDWKKDAVLYAVLLTPTNSLRVTGWGEDKTGIRVLQVQWSGIEPFYGNNYPAVFARIPKDGLKRAVISVSFGKETLNTVVFGDAKKDTNGVRPLEIDRKGIRPGFGKRGAQAYKSLDELEKAHGESIAAQVKKLVDFAKENVVVVNWTTGGPPFGVLKHEMKKTDKGASIVFYVQGPKVNRRGQALKLGFDLFAAPKDVPVTLAKGER